MMWQAWMDEGLVRRLGWTLLHSLWLVTALAAAAKVVLVGMRGATAQARYAAATGTLGLMLAAVVATFVVLRPADRAADIARDYTPLPQAATVAVARPAERPEVLPGEELRVAPLKIDAPRVAAQVWPGVMMRLRVGVEPWLPWLVAVWGMGVVGLGLWYSGCWVAAQRLCGARTRPAGQAVEAALARLAARMRVTRPVRLLESWWARTPLVVGYWRPVILLPVAMLTALTPAQVEAILAHELAHIRRQDYLVNLLQSLVETVLFHHPGVWWISGVMRREREHCCDDVAAEVCGDRVAYAEALVAVAEVDGASPRMALAARGRGGELLARIGRLLGAAEGRPVRGARALAAAVTIGALVVAAVPAVISAGAPGKPAAKQTTSATEVQAFAGGGTAELWGVSVHPSKEGVWWRADGTEATIPDRLGGLKLVGGEGRPYEFLVQLEGAAAKAVNLNIQFEPAARGMSVSPVAAADGKTVVAGRWQIAALIPEGVQRVTMRIGVVNGEWKELGESPRNGASAISGQDFSCIFGTDFEVEGDAAVTVTHTPVERDVRLVAVDVDGVVHMGHRERTARAGPLALVTGRFAGVPRERVKFYRLEAAEYQWVEFEDVELQPRRGQAGEHAVVGAGPVVAAEVNKEASIGAAPARETTTALALRLVDGKGEALRKQGLQAYRLFSGFRDGMPRGEWADQEGVVHFKDLPAGPQRLVVNAEWPHPTFVEVNVPMAKAVTDVVVKPRDFDGPAPNLNVNAAPSHYEGTILLHVTITNNTLTSYTLSDTDLSIVSHDCRGFPPPSQGYGGRVVPARGQGELRLTLNWSTYLKDGLWSRCNDEGAGAPGLRVKVGINHSLPLSVALPTQETLRRFGATVDEETLQSIFTGATLLQQFNEAKYQWQQAEVGTKLIALGDKSVIPAMAELLKSPERGRRCNAGRVLAGLGDERGFAAVVAEVQDKRGRPVIPEMVRGNGEGYVPGQILQDRYYAIHVLGQIGDMRAVPVLLEVLVDDELAYVAAYVLGELGDPRALPALRGRLAEVNHKDHSWFGLALAKMGDPAGLPVVLAGLGQKNWGTRRRTAEVLGELGDRRAIPALIKALEDEHANVRVAAARALGMLKAEAAMPALERLITDHTRTENGPVVVVSADVLEVMKQIRIAVPRAEDASVPLRFVPVEKSKGEASWSALNPQKTEPATWMAMLHVGLEGTALVQDGAGETRFKVRVAAGDDDCLVVEVRGPEGVELVELPRGKTMRRVVGGVEYRLEFAREWGKREEGAVRQQATILVTMEEEKGG